MSCLSCILSDDLFVRMVLNSTNDVLLSATVTLRLCPDSAHDTTLKQIDSSTAQSLERLDFLHLRGIGHHNALASKVWQG